MDRPSLNLDAIEDSLRTVQGRFKSINSGLDCPRDALDDRVVGNVLEGYRYIDQLIAENVDILAPGNLKYLLELNARVLFGTDPHRRISFADHFRETDRRFYEQIDGGIGDLIEWYGRHRNETPWKRAAGTYIRVLSAPQLFIEGNHRTGSLVASYLLVRSGQPPFVLSVDNAKAFFDPSTVVTKTRKRGLALLLDIPHIKRYFARFLQEQAEQGQRYLRRPPARGLKAAAQ